jgi:geranylgeranyl diphosphate synthase type II
MRYSVLSGGKRLRPVLVLASCQICGGDPETALPGAAAIECVHAFSLIHDDLPIMDDDDFRRGQPTVHKVYGDAIALLAGDALLALAFDIITDGYPTSPISSKLCAELADAVGWRGMIGGQAADLLGERQPVQRDLVEYIHRHKTGRLIRCACRMGAIVAEAGQEDLLALTRYGENLGLAFQITDDLLDVTATEEQTGKRTGKDAQAGKQTYPRAVGVKESRRQAEKTILRAIEALEPIGEEADQMIDIAHAVLRRYR